MRVSIASCCSNDAVAVEVEDNRDGEGGSLLLYLAWVLFRCWVWDIGSLLSMRDRIESGLPDRNLIRWKYGHSIHS